MPLRQRQPRITRLFYEEEIRYRELMGYPPAEQLLAVLYPEKMRLLLEKGCHYLKEYILRVIRDCPAEKIRAQGKRRQTGCRQRCDRPGKSGDR